MHDSNESGLRLVGKARAWAFQKVKPGQKPSQASTLAWLGLASFWLGLAWLLASGWSQQITSHVLVTPSLWFHVFQLLVSVS
jgi:hypothetical protein